MGWLMMQTWSPYVAGAGIGIIACLTLLLLDRPLGTSTAYARTAGMIGKLFNKRSVERNPYYQRFTPSIDWQWMIVIGIIAGAYLSSKLSGQFEYYWLPKRWVALFGSSIALRVIVAFVGGTVMGFGARWADGCTSGHGISGMMQLAASGWIAVMCFFIGGIVTAMLFYHVF